MKLPEQAPPQMMIPFIGHVPPALGTPDAKPAQPRPAQPQPAAPRAPVPQTVTTAPTVIPQTTEPVAASSATTADAAAADGGGNGQQLGVPWGSPEGVGVDGPPVTATVAQPAAPVRVTGDVLPPVVLRRVQPLYPAPAMRARLGGFVIVECIIDRSGIVRDAKVTHSSSRLFEQSALDAVQQWQFKPGSLYGQPVDVIFDLTVKFEINR